MSEVKYPNATAVLVGKDGNVFLLAGLVRRAIVDAGYGVEAGHEFITEVFDCGSYDEFLRLAMRTVNVS